MNDITYSPIDRVFNRVLQKEFEDPSGFISINTLVTTGVIEIDGTTIEVDGTTIEVDK